MSVGAKHHPRSPTVAEAAERLFARAVQEQQSGRVAEAEQLFEQVLGIDPDHRGALTLYAVLALQVGRPQAALELAQRATVAHPESAEAWQFLGLAQHQCGRLGDAIASFGRAAELDGEYFDARVNLGNALLEAGRPSEALAHYRRALEIDAASASAHNNLGNAYRDLRRPEEAIASYRRALEIDPRHARALGNLGNVLRDIGDIEGAIAATERSLALSPDQADVWSNLLLTLQGSERHSAEAIAAVHRAFGARFAVPAGAQLARGLAPRSARGSRLRIGYISSDFRKHVVATFFEPVLGAHDRERFEITCYYNRPNGDEVTARIRDRAEHFAGVAAMSDAALAARIRDEGVDILVDLNGHTADNRLPMFMLKPALVQATWLGYLGTTGVAAIDYRLTDARVDPPGATEHLHTEALWRLPATMWCYQPYSDAPAVGPLPAQAHGHVTFVSLNNPGKVTAGMLDLWVDVLRAVPESRLVLLAPVHTGRRAQLAASFAAKDIAAERLELVERVPLSDYLALYRRVDVALDTHPYAGGTTTCDALWMGVPVVTLAGSRPFSRTGASVLGSLGLGDLVGEAPEQYVRIAVALATDHERLAALRAGLREKMRGSPLTDAVRFARDLEDAYRTMYERAAAAAHGGRT
jgi:predicted O-linked N-acetylglucosamine transferase (SPINDLY family)